MYVCVCAHMCALATGGYKNQVKYLTQANYNSSLVTFYSHILKRC